MMDLFDILMGFNNPLLENRKNAKLGNGFYTDENGQIMHDLVSRAFLEKEQEPEEKILKDEAKTIEKKEDTEDTVNVTMENVKLASESEGNKALFNSSFEKRGDKWVLRPFGDKDIFKDMSYIAEVTKDGKLVITFESGKSDPDDNFSFNFTLKNTYDLPVESDWSTVTSHKTESGVLEFSVEENKHIANSSKKYVVYDYKVLEPLLTKDYHIDGLTDDVERVEPSELSEKDITDRECRILSGYRHNFHPDQFKFTLYDDVYVYQPSLLLPDPDYTTYRTVWVDHGVLKYNVVYDYSDLDFEDPEENTLIMHSLSEYQISLPVDADWGSVRAIVDHNGGLIIVANKIDTVKKEYEVK